MEMQRRSSTHWIIIERYAKVDRNVTLVAKHTHTLYYEMTLRNYQNVEPSQNFHSVCKSKIEMFFFFLLTFLVNNNNNHSVQAASGTRERNRERERERSTTHAQRKM